jgi:sugar phosphate isomerase/epimerase
VPKRRTKVPVAIEMYSVKDEEKKDILATLRALAEMGYEGVELSAGADPVAFIKANPGRIKSYQLKDWSPDKEKGYKVLLGEGSGDWPKILEAAETVGGVDYYLIEQDGSRFSPLETAKRCLENLRKVRGEA